MPGPNSLMVSSPASCMTEAQQEMVKAPLRVALKGGRYFKDSSAVYEYLRHSGISPDLISAHQTEIFDCYLGVDAEAKGQLPPSPSTSVESRLNATEIGLDGDDRSDQSDFAGPAFDSEEILNISFFRPLRNDFKPLTAKICTGRVSYISDKVLRDHNLKRRRKSIILDWCYIGSNNNELSHTRCEVVKSEVLPGCEIALAEEHEKGDIEYTEEGTEEGENTELSKEPLNDMVVYRLEATSYDLSPEQEALALDAMAELTVRNSILFAKRKAPEPASSHFSSTSFATESQRKRSKLS